MTILFLVFVDFLVFSGRA